MKWIITTIAASAFVALPASAQTYSIGTNPQGSSAYATGAAVAKVASEVAKLRARVVPQGGPVVTLPLVNKGQLNFSIAVSVVTAFAYDGKAMFKGRAQKNIRVVAVVRTLYTGLMTRKDSGLMTPADMKGKRVASNFAKQRIAGLFLRAKMAAAGLTMKDVTPVPVPNGVRSVDDLAAGKLDVTSFSLTSGKVRQANASVGIRYLSIPNTPAAQAALQKVSPGAIIATVNPSPRFPGITGPTNVLAALFIVTASSKVPEEAVYKLTKALNGNKEKLVAAFKGMAAFNPDKMHIDFGVPYHPGAMKFYRETGQAK